VTGCNESACGPATRARRSRCWSPAIPRPAIAAPGRYAAVGAERGMRNRWPLASNTKCCGPEQTDTCSDVSCENIRRFACGLDLALSNIASGVPWRPEIRNAVFRSNWPIAVVIQRQAGGRADGSAHRRGEIRICDRTHQRRHLWLPQQLQRHRVCSAPVEFA
jgi:hypothetical protein